MISVDARYDDGRWRRGEDCEPYLQRVLNDVESDRLSTAGRVSQLSLMSRVLLIVREVGTVRRSLFSHGSGGCFGSGR